MKTETKRSHSNFTWASHKAKAVVAWIISLALTILLLYYFTELKRLI